MKNLHSINREQRLYVLHCAGGYSCLGFDVAERKRLAVLEWIGERAEPMRKGTKRHYAAYLAAMAKGARHNRETGERCPADLSTALIGLEGRRVEVIEPGGDRKRFIVGKSMGWMPVHLEIARRNSTGGPAAYVPQNATVRLVA